MNESALACKASRGDKEALKQLLSKNWDWLKRLVFSYISSAADTDDVLQNICVRVITKIHTLNEPERFRQWLAAIGRNESIDYRRKNRRQPQHLEESEIENAAVYDEDTVERKELQRQASEALKRLPEKYREVLVLQLSGNMTYSEISETLDIPVTTVQIRLVRARRMLKDILTGKEINRIPRT